MLKRTIVAASLLLAFATAAAAAEGDLEIFPSGFDECIAPERESGGFIEFVVALLSILRCVILTLPKTQFGQLIALFLLLIFPVNQFVLKPLFGVLEQRTARIDGTRKRAAEVGAQADAALARYSAAVEEARKQASELRQQALEGARGDQVRILAEARHTAEEELGAARSGVAGALAEARVALRSESRGLAREAAARVLGRPLS